MIVKHLGFVPEADKSTFIASNAVVCGNVKIGKNCRIMYGASIVAEGGKIEIGDNCVILENAVLRSTVKHNLKIGNKVLVGPNAHVAGCQIEDNVFIATGASIFHGAKVCKFSEVRVNGIVHLRTVLPEKSIIPINWVAVGDPVNIFPPDKHEEIWAIQKPLNFPKTVYGIDRKASGEPVMPEIMDMMTDALKSHLDDEIIG